MSYSPTDILDYILDNEKDADFMLSLSMHKHGYSIGEIPDFTLEWNDDKLMMKSSIYKIEIQVSDMDIMIASKNNKYISAFISRFNNTYQIHFLVHEYFKEEKSKYEEEIANRVVQYMILKAIKQLRLDSPEKVDNYIK